MGWGYFIDELIDGREYTESTNDEKTRREFCILPNEWRSGGGYKDGEDWLPEEIVVTSTIVDRETFPVI